MGGALSCVKSKEKKSAAPAATTVANRTHNYETIDDSAVGITHVPDTRTDTHSDGSERSPGTASKVRRHPYDEISDEQIAESRAAAEVATTNANGCAGASGMTSQQKRRSASAVHEGVEGDEVTDLYTKVNKVKLKQREQPPGAESPSQLNYIEVEFNTEANQTQARRTQAHTPTTYTSVMNDNGKVVLLTDS